MWAERWWDQSVVRVIPELSVGYTMLIGHHHLTISRIETVRETKLLKLLTILSRHNLINLWPRGKMSASTFCQISLTGWYWPFDSFMSVLHFCKCSKIECSSHSLINHRLWIIVFFINFKNIFQGWTDRHLTLPDRGLSLSSDSRIHGLIDPDTDRIQGSVDLLSSYARPKVKSFAFD